MRFSLIHASGLFGFGGIALASLAPIPADAPDYSKSIAPLLKAKCAVCHGAPSASGGLRLDSPEAIAKGGLSGRLFEPKRGAQSLLVKRLRGEGGTPQMPMGFAPLSEKEIQTIIDWIDAGASFGSGSRAKHWSYTAPARPPLPTVRNHEWVKNPIDAFILSRLEKEGLAASPEASREMLLRRLSLDLTGLPPTVGELDAFLSDKAPIAYEKQIDRLLASPHYGEKMARAWLDLARYADTNGYEKDLPRQMWLWRDWVIDAFNRNMPYDEFTIEQLAGDLLPHPTTSQLVATGFHRNSMLNDEGGIDPEEFRVVAVMDRVDATATTWLGTTMACAQCHDHKYDPISQRDYYRFYAFFNQTADNGRDKEPILQVPGEGQKAKLEALEKELSRAKQELMARTPSALAELPQWEADYRASWHPLKPMEWKSQAELTLLPDDSLLASGPDPVQDEYRVSYRLPKEIISGIRIDAIPDPSLPEGSSGRNFNGNFVLRRVEAAVRHSDGSSTRVKFEKASADFTQGGHDPMSTILEGEGEGWAIAGFEPKNRVRHLLSIKLASPFSAKDGDVLEVAFIHQSKHKNHNLGRFRLEICSGADRAGETPPTASVREALAKDESKRTPEETESIRQYFLSLSPSLVEPRREIARLEKEIRDLEGSFPTTLVLRELEKPRLDRMLKRGDFRTPGDPVLPGTPRALGGYSARSDRLGLARWIVSPQNPLTARVQVNRIWQQLFGQGLVATPEDFGTQGAEPTHPELLDWLATEYMRIGWDTKKLIKLIVSSSTYRQSSKASPESLAKDPDNLLLARGPRFRVAAEEVRDIALFSSGRLSPTIGGPSVMPPQPPGVWENSFTFYDTKDRWVDEEGPNRYRRGLYTYWRRTAPFPMALTFDLKTRDVCVSKRSRTNTPLQALNTLNDPLFVECAGELGKRMMLAADRARARDKASYGTPKVGDNWDDEGLVFGFRSCTSRAPKPAELAALKNLLGKSRSRYSGDADAAVKLLSTARMESKEDRTAENAAWTVVANAILNLDEAMVKG